MFGINLAKFFKRLLGNVYLAAAAFIAAQETAVVPAIEAAAPQGEAAIVKAINDELAKAGAEGEAIEPFVGMVVNSLGTDAINLAAKDAPAFFNALVEKLKAHGETLLA